MAMKKHLKITFNAPMILGFVGICFLATLSNYMTAGEANRILFMTYRANPLSPLTWLRSFTHIFGHADWNHLVGNMSLILLLGPMLEEKYGPVNIAEVIGITALATSLIHMLFFPNAALCGASGVVFAFILMSSFTSFKEGEIPLTFILVSVFFIGQQVVEGITVQDNISNTGHIIGGIVGGYIGFMLNRKK